MNCKKRKRLLRTNMTDIDQARIAAKEHLYFQQQPTCKGKLVAEEFNRLPTPPPSSLGLQQCSQKRIIPADLAKAILFHFTQII